MGLQVGKLQTFSQLHILVLIQHPLIVMQLSMHVCMYIKLCTQQTLDLRNEGVALWLLHQGKVSYNYFLNTKFHLLVVDIVLHMYKHFVCRHYLDFINHFVKLHREKCSELEEQQLHLNVGLGKIAETVEQVEEMQKSLAVKSQVCK